jgi:hypothetical protein
MLLELFTLLELPPAALELWDPEPPPDVDGAVEAVLPPLPLGDEPLSEQANVARRSVSVDTTTVVRHLDEPRLQGFVTGEGDVSHLGLVAALARGLDKFLKNCCRAQAG